MSNATKKNKKKDENKPKKSQPKKIDISQDPLLPTIETLNEDIQVAAHKRTQLIQIIQQGEQARQELLRVEGNIQALKDMANKIGAQMADKYNVQKDTNYEIDMEKKELRLSGTR